jgi:methylated-DNA-[protein]-cysteine S-methyltransferase
MRYFTVYPSPLGEITLACDGDSLVGAWIEGQKYHGEPAGEEMTAKDDLPAFDAARKWLDRYFSGGRPRVSELPLKPAGGEFRQTVWSVLREIPYGETITYGEVAKITAAKMHKKSMSAQAVGGAIGHNPISIIIPCHRVVGANGSLTGYAGGVDKKLKLLKAEGVDVSRLFVPA